ncbi:MAG: LLM class flavin-dependent oxidoreductase, partial [Micromonosporaceae bacterium]
HHDGVHYQVKPTDFFPPPPPVQRPRIPIWVVGAWPRMKSMRRAVAWDGWLPYYKPVEPSEPQRPMNRPWLEEEFPAAVEWLAAQRGTLEGYDIIADGATPAEDPDAAAAAVRPWAQAGATWWIEGDWSVPADRVPRYAERRLRAGPPRV